MIKKIFPWVLVFVVVVLLIIPFFKSDSKKLKESKDKYQGILKERDQLKEKYRNALIAIEKKEEQGAAIESEIKETDKEIAKTKAKVKDLPKPAGKFFTLPECQLQFDILRKDYDERGRLIVFLSARIFLSDKQAAKLKEASQEKSEALKVAEMQKANLLAGEDEQKKQADIYRKQKSPLFAVVVGGGISVNGRFYVGISAGLNVTGLIRRIF